MEIYAALYTRHTDVAGADRFQFFLDTETRPDFPEEVDETESDLVAVFEGVDIPESITRPSPHEVIADFEMLSGDPRRDLADVLERFGVQQALWYESDGGDLNVYYLLRNGVFNFLYSPIPLDDPEDDEKHNRQLPSRIIAELDKAATKGTEQALTTLARALSELGSP